MRRFLHVEDLVHGEGARLTETLAALVAFERFLFAVNVSEILKNLISGV